MKSLSKHIQESLDEKSSKILQKKINELYVDFDVNNVTVEYVEKLIKDNDSNIEAYKKALTKKDESNERKTTFKIQIKELTKRNKILHELLTKMK